MSHRESLIKEALQLDADDRVFIADALLKSIEQPAEELTEEEKKEILRRRDEMIRDPKIGVSWDRIKSELKSSK